MKMRSRARECGWAVAVHGSMERDLDIVAVPWIEQALDENAFVEAVREAVAEELNGQCFVSDRKPDSKELQPTIKPNGRHSYTLHALSDELVHSSAGVHPFIDLSVMDFRNI